MDQRIYNIRVGELAARLVMPADVPELSAATLELRVADEGALVALVERLGGIGRFANPARVDRLLTIYHAKDEGGDICVDVHVWLEGALASRPVSRTPMVVQRMLDGASRSGLPAEGKASALGRVREGEEFPGARVRAEEMGLPTAGLHAVKEEPDG